MYKKYTEACTITNISLLRRFTLIYITIYCNFLSYLPDLMHERPFMDTYSYFQALLAVKYKNHGTEVAHMPYILFLTLNTNFRREYVILGSNNTIIKNPTSNYL